MLRRWMFIMLLCLFAAPAAAQDETPLLAMLARVPASQLGVQGGYISYADYEAIFGQAGLNPQTAAEYDLMENIGLQDAWFANARRIYSGLPSVIQYLAVGYTDSLEIHGFEWFAIDQSLTFGSPPTQGAILAGDFDTDAVIEAFTARGYQPVEIGGVTTLCPLDGCDEGMRIDFSSRDPAFLFGGQLGRRELVAPLPGLLLNSPALETMEAMIAAQGDQPSLLDTPDYRALVKTLYTPADAQLMQLNVFNAADIVDFAVPEGLNTNAIGMLPPYSLAALADYQAGDDQLVQVLLVYDDEASAEAAALELGQRVEDFDIGGIYAETNARLDSTQVYTASDRWVVVAGVRYPLPSDDEDGDPVPPGQIYRLWMNALARREFVPIAANIGNQ